MDDVPIEGRAAGAVGADGGAVEGAVVGVGGGGEVNVVCVRSSTLSLAPAEPGNGADSEVVVVCAPASDAHDR